MAYFLGTERKRRMSFWLIKATPVCGRRGVLAGWSCDWSRAALEAIGRSLSGLSSSRYASKGVEMASDGCQWQEEMAKCVSKSSGLVVVGRYLSRFIATDSYQLGSGVKRSFEED